MVQRRYKLAAAGLVLLLGLCLAWPLRKREAIDLSPAGSKTVASPPVAATEPAAVFQPVTPVRGPDPTEAELVADASTDVSPVSGLISPTSSGAPFAEAIGGATIESASAGLARDAIGPNRGSAPAIGDSVATDPPYRVHVIHNGDTLQRLAKRYLGDESRSLEIFDLNREVLSNPHLLPIGAELKVPAAQTED